MTARSRSRPAQGADRRNRFGLLTDPETSARLGRVRQKGTRSELEVRRLLRGLGHHFRVNNRNLPGSPDIANRRRAWAIFVHGCFWHRHPGCRRATTPKRNRAFWEAKFATNQERDRRVVAALRALGFRTITVWECEVDENPGRLARRLARALQRRG